MKWWPRRIFETRRMREINPFDLARILPKNSPVPEHKAKPQASIRSF
jgi:hypothetical protein